jgi:hypothetical protein
LKQFLIAHPNTIAYAFVVYLNRIAPNKKSFPLALIPTHQGNWTDEIFTLFMEVARVLQENSVSHEGDSADGDKQFAQCYQSLFQESLNLGKYNFNSPLSESFPDFRSRNFFTDLLNLIKNVRYQFVQGTPLWIYPWGDLLLLKSDLNSIGIPDYILFDSRAKKTRRFISFIDVSISIHQWSCFSEKKRAYFFVITLVSSSDICD